MNMQTTDIDRQMILRYTDQPPVLPQALRAQIDDLWNSEPIVFYALADLDASNNLRRTWVVLSPNRLAVASKDGDNRFNVNTFERRRITEVRQSQGLSGTVLSIVASDQDAPLCTLRYSHRQRRTMEDLKFILDQQLHNGPLPLSDADEVYAGSVVQAIKEAQASVSGNRLAVVWRLTAYLKPYRKQIIAGMIAATILTVLSLLPPYLTKAIIDGVATPYRTGELSASAAKETAGLILIALAVVFLMRTFCGWVRLRTMAMVGEYVARDLRDELYGHVQQLSLSYFKKKQTGSIISRVSSDTDRLWDFIAFGIVEVSLSVIMLIGLGGVLIWLDWKLGLILVLPMPLLIFAISTHGRKMRHVFLKVWRKWSDMVSVLSDTIPGMQVVMAFNQESREQQRFALKNKDVLYECCSVHSMWTKFWPLLMLTFNIMTLLVWTFALPRLFAADGAGAMTVGTFVSFLMYMGMFMHPIETIGMMARMLNRATSSAHRVFEVLDTEPKITNAPDAICLDPLDGRVSFDNVYFAYDEVRQIIKGISFDVEPGDMIGLVGPSGAGKTTIINLIARFYDITGGQLLIDGVDIRQLDCGHYRRQIGIVQQDTFLFHGTILENIRYGLPDADVHQVIEAARAANAHDFICAFPHGYDTMVGERGHTLSGGERQRISIARAILCDPRILILDEATSSVDTETEKKIQEALDRLIPGRTVFAIAHRLSTLNRASRLLVIEDGRITEQGRHIELLEKPEGTYKRMYEIQNQLHEYYAV